MRKVSNIIIFCIVYNVINHNVVSAQIFHPKDSVRKQRIMQIGIGVFTGVNRVTPLSDGFRYKSTAGLENGATASLYMNVTNQFYVQAGFRMSNRTALLAHGNDFYFESFYQSQNVSQLPLMINYRVNHKHKNLFDLGLGTAYNRIHHQTDNLYTLQYPPGLGNYALEGQLYLYDRVTTGASYTINLSKTVYIHKWASLSFFTELEWVKPKIDVLNVFTNTRPLGDRVNFWTSYHSSLYRFGVMLKL
jgi:hypothetical protein